MAYFKSPLSASEWLSMGIDKPVLKTTEMFQLTEWLVVFVDVPNQVS